MSTLLQKCLDTAASSIKSYSSLSGLPEELTVCLFELVLQRGKLSPAVVQMFMNTEHEAVVERILSLRLREPPPLPGGNDRWLHQKPSLY